MVEQTFIQPLIPGNKEIIGVILSFLFNSNTLGVRKNLFSALWRERDRLLSTLALQEDGGIFVFCTQLEKNYGFRLQHPLRKGH